VMGLYYVVAVALSPRFFRTSLVTAPLWATSPGHFASFQDHHKGSLKDKSIQVNFDRREEESNGRKSL
jgi:hypothetical protein